MVEVKRQADIGSQRWGVYVDGALVEGGFFSCAAAHVASAAYTAVCAHVDDGRGRCTKPAGHDGAHNFRAVDGNACDMCDGTGIDDEGNKCDDCGGSGEAL